ncbi:SF3a splicing factor complex subunit [Coemansia sp. RSA 1200]|nr:SF3a splicing factor complex subunit [Coemansia sp. RSA 1200]
MADVQGPASANSTAEIIYPPQNIKTIVDKTAEHVAKSGEAFQQLIRDKYQGNVRFSFIYANDPYFAYYDMMVSKYRSGGETSEETDGDTELSSIAAADALNATEDPAAGAKQQLAGESSPTTAVPDRPAEPRFVTAMPAISALDLDVIRMTAQFVACNGRSFMTMLAQREQNNYQFDFLSPTHSLFGYFRKLVDQYTMVYGNNKPRPQELDSLLAVSADDRFRVLDRVDKRIRWAAYEAKERNRREVEAENERTAFLSIDWHDFVVVGTVEFVEEDAYLELPPPIRLQDLKSMSLEQKRRTVAGGKSTTEQPDHRVLADSRADANDDEDNDVDMEVEMDEESADEESSVDEEIEAEPRPPPGAAGSKPTGAANTLGPMRIRKNHVPLLRSGPQSRGVTLQCQLCKQDIPASEFEEHIRVELIDPKWKEQKLVYERKIRDSNLVKEGMDVARYLKQMAGHRADIFGTDGEPQEGGEAGSAQEPPASAGKPTVPWDGYSSTATRAARRARENMSDADRVAEMRRRNGLPDPRDASPSIGPQAPHPHAPKRRKN